MFYEICVLLSYSLGDLARLYQSRCRALRQRPREYPGMVPPSCCSPSALDRIVVSSVPSACLWREKPRRAPKVDTLARKLQEAASFLGKKKNTIISTAFLHRLPVATQSWTESRAPRRLAAKRTGTQAKQLEAAKQTCRYDHDIMFRISNL
jgi:hypothetical protein